MSYTRREFGMLALAGLPAAAMIGRGEFIPGAFARSKPDSLINGVQIGAITYSFRSMPDQSAEATLKYKWKMPASIELEYEIPEGSDAVKEVRKCVEYCRHALASA